MGSTARSTGFGFLWALWLAWACFTQVATLQACRTLQKCLVQGLPSGSMENLFLLGGQWGTTLLKVQVLWSKFIAPWTRGATGNLIWTPPRGHRGPATKGRAERENLFQGFASKSTHESFTQELVSRKLVGAFPWQMCGSLCPTLSRRRNSSQISNQIGPKLGKWPRLVTSFADPCFSIWEWVQSQFWGSPRAIMSSKLSGHESSFQTGRRRELGEQPEGSSPKGLTQGLDTRWKDLGVHLSLACTAAPH